MLLVLYFVTERKSHLAQTKYIRRYPPCSSNSSWVVLVFSSLCLVLKSLKCKALKALFSTYQISVLSHGKSPLLSDSMLPESHAERLKAEEMSITNSLLQLSLHSCKICQKAKI